MVNETVRQRMHDSVDNIMNKAEDMGNKSMERINQIKEKGIEMRGNLDNYIQKNPERSVLIAAGIGAIVGATITAVIIKKVRGCNKN